VYSLIPRPKGDNRHRATRIWPVVDFFYPSRHIAARGNRLKTVNPCLRQPQFIAGKLAAATLPRAYLRCTKSEMNPWNFVKLDRLDFGSANSWDRRTSSNAGVCVNSGRFFFEIKKMSSWGQRSCGQFALETAAAEDKDFTSCNLFALARLTAGIKRRQRPANTSRTMSCCHR